MTPDALSVVVTNLCVAVPDQKVFSRKVHRGRVAAAVVLQVPHQNSGRGSRHLCWCKSTRAQSHIVIRHSRKLTIPVHTHLHHHHITMSGHHPRQECARALGCLAGELCPMRAAAVAPPYLPKILAQLKKYLQVCVWGGGQGGQLC